MTDLDISLEFDEERKPLVPNRNYCIRNRQRWHGLECPLVFVPLELTGIWSYIDRQQSQWACVFISPCHGVAAKHHVEDIRYVSWPWLAYCLCTHSCNESVSWLYFLVIVFIFLFTWCCHQMQTFSKLLALCAGHSPVSDEFPSQRPVRQSLVFFLFCAWTNSWVNNRDAGDLRRHRGYYDVFLPLS